MAGDKVNDVLVLAQGTKRGVARKVCSCKTRMSPSGRFRPLEKDKTGHSPNKWADVRFLLLSGLFESAARTTGKAELHALTIRQVSEYSSHLNGSSADYWTGRFWPKAPIRHGTPEQAIPTTSNNQTSINNRGVCYGNASEARSME